MAALRCAPCGWRRVLAAGVLMALALVALDIATDYDEDDDAGLRPRGMLFDEVDDDGPDDLWTLETKMSRGFAPGTRSNGCDRVDALVVADGELGERVHAVCAASAMTALSSLLTLAVWPADRHMPHVRFSHLFSLTPPAPASSSADSPATPAPNATAGGGSGGGRGSGESAFVGGPERRVWVRESALPAAAWRSELNLARRTVRDLDMAVQVVGAPLLREADGLAMSSRNVRLTPEHRQQALSISSALLAAKAAVEAAHSGAGESERGEGHAQAADASAVVERVRRTVEEAGGRVEYVQLVEQESLEPISRITHPAVLAVAAHFGSVRLIDNVEIDVHT
ncbi:unnamed protein product [Closterium sp. Naga37s-1]|nr:unnamed protein product [Closterium sp. Naga37s-1]